MYIFRGVDPEVRPHPPYCSTEREREERGERRERYIPRNTVPCSWCNTILIPCQEPVVSSGHICSFESMEVRSVLLDEVMKDPENPGDDLVVDLDIKVSVIQW